MDPTSGMMTEVLNLFRAAMAGGYSNVADQANSLLYWLIMIEVIIAIGFNVLWDFAIQYFVYRVVAIGVIIWMTTNFSTLVNGVIESFFQLGLMAANADIQPVTLRDPSSIIDIGFNITQPIVEYLANISLWDSMINAQDTVMMGLSLIGIMLAFFIIAVQVFMVYLEFSLVATLGVIFVPFGVLLQTKFMLERIIHAVISFGVRFAMLSAIVSIGSAAVQSFALPPDPTWKQAFVMFTSCGAIAMLAWHAPSVAAGLLAGSPSLSAVIAGSSALAGGAGAKTISEQSQNTASTAKGMASILAAASVTGASSIKSGVQKASQISVEQAAKVPNGF